MRQNYGPRFFDVVVVDSWYANGPFLKTVAKELGWPVIAVLKQERYEAHQEALALTRRQRPTRVVRRGQRQVEIWDVPAMRFTDSYPGHRTSLESMRNSAAVTDFASVGEAAHRPAPES